MNESTDRSHEINTKNAEYQSLITAITERALTSENIATYADDALADLIIIVERITASYRQHPTLQFEKNIDEERAALRYAGADADYVEATLDYIADTADDIKGVFILADKLAEGASGVITPPDAKGMAMGSGGGTFEKTLIPRLQTVMLILEKNFSVDLEDQEQFRLVPGSVTKDMVRKTPYNLLDVPALNRVVNVCNEEGNRSFVFDREKLKEQAIDVDALKDMTKDELKELLELQPGLGRDLVYDRQTFVTQITQLLGDIGSSQITEHADADKFLLPIADERILSGNRIKVILNDLYGSLVNHKTIYKVAAELAAEELIRNQRYRFGKKRVTYGYTHEEFEHIHERLGDMGLLYPKAGPGEISFPGGAADMIGVGPETIYRLADDCGVDVESMPYRRFVSATARACSQNDIDILLSHLSTKPLIARANVVPKYDGLRRLSEKELADAVATAAGFESIKTICEELGIDRRQLTLDSNEEISAIREESLRKGFMYPPEGNMSVPMITEALAVDRKVVDRAIEELGDTLGTVDRYIHGPRPFLSYSPHQIEQIAVLARGYVKGRAPSMTVDRFTAPMVANQLGIDKQFARKILEGEAFELRFKDTHNFATYDQATIDRLNHDARVVLYRNAQPAPAGVQSRSTFAKKWHIAPLTVEKLARKYHMPLGTFRFGSQIRDGYSGNDRDFLYHVLDNEHYFAPEVGEGEYTFPVAAPAVNLADAVTVKKVVKILQDSDESFGELEWRKASGNRAQVLNARQLAILDAYVTENNMRRARKHSV